MCSRTAVPSTLNLPTTYRLNKMTRTSHTACDWFPFICLLKSLLWLLYWILYFLFTFPLKLSLLFSSLSHWNLYFSVFLDWNLYFLFTCALKSYFFASLSSFCTTITLREAAYTSFSKCNYAPQKLNGHAAKASQAASFHDGACTHSLREHTDSHSAFHSKFHAIPRLPHKVCPWT